MRDPVRLEWCMPACGHLDAICAAVGCMTAAVIGWWATAHGVAAERANASDPVLLQVAAAVVCGLCAAAWCFWRWTAGHRLGVAWWLRMEDRLWHWGRLHASATHEPSARRGQVSAAWVIGPWVLIKARAEHGAGDWGATDWMWVDTRLLGAEGGALRTALNWA